MSGAGQDWSWTKSEDRIPPEVDTSKPSIARVYDYFLGGKDNFAVDREIAEMVFKIDPNAAETGHANRGFLRRVVRHLTAEAGIRQFLDIGSGLPTQGNVHEVAQAVDPLTRVVYVDNDPIVLAHGRALLATNNTTTVIQADIREPESILNDPKVQAFIDFDEPVGLLLFAILHHLGDNEDPEGIAARFRDILPSGSYLAVSHFFNPGEAHPEVSKQVLESERICNEKLGTGRWRTQDEIQAYFGDFEMVDPGLVPLSEWRPDPEDLVHQGSTYYTIVGGLARKP
ncbi:SAM-dependent methyltransferase [Sphaerisporangium aureirubrum]|uniref:SAM-dependent methyltransferase n=1 Tax=Sphaerisporangium aureirubrum TaxID=1544736 RepID=A0ABW1NJL8_9ACTN